MSPAFYMCFFSYKSVLKSFSLITVIIFCQKNMDKKVARKMFVKLTTGSPERLAKVA